MWAIDKLFFKRQTNFEVKFYRIQTNKNRRIILSVADDYRECVGKLYFKQEKEFKNILFVVKEGKYFVKLSVFQIFEVKSFK